MRWKAQLPLSPPITSSAAVRTPTVGLFEQQTRELLQRGLELGEVDRGRVIVLGIVAFEPEHDVGHLVGGRAEKSAQVRVDRSTT